MDSFVDQAMVYTYHTREQEQKSYTSLPFSVIGKDRDQDCRSARKQKTTLDPEVKERRMHLDKAKGAGWTRFNIALGGGRNTTEPSVEEVYGPKMTTVWNEMTTEERRLTSLGAVEETIARQMKAFVDGVESPSFSYPVCTWNNVILDPAMGIVPERDSSPVITCTRFSTGNNASQRYTRVLEVLQWMQQILANDQFVTKRELYYRNVKHFPHGQRDVDDVVNVISVMLQIPRRELRVLSCSKGLVAGNLRFVTTDGVEIDCCQATECGGELISQDVDGLHDFFTDAEAVLIVEKDATFQTLIKNGFLAATRELILVTGKGIPDLNTRQLVRRLWMELGLPVLCLVDGDPYGVEIMCVYRFGSLSTIWCTENLAVPTLKWVGLHPSEFPHLDEEAMVVLSSRDRAKLDSLRRRPYMQVCPGLLEQLNMMEHQGRKAEIQNVPSLSSYIHEKLQRQDWI